MTTVHSFPPVSGGDSRVLILGSMPGRISLQRNEYYAHPRNAFWPIAAELFGFDSSLGYSERKRALEQSRIALWDVLKTCTRSTSLDSDIVESSIVANDFTRFFSSHPEIRVVAFNGAKAAQVFLRHVLPTMDALQSEIPRVRLPSTSPAYAAMAYEEKLSTWRRALAMPGSTDTANGAVANET
jgi:TDG/mug DNA glycosylase family protein